MNIKNLLQIIEENEDNNSFTISTHSVKYYLQEIQKQELSVLDAPKFAYLVQQKKYFIESRTFLK